MENDMKVQRFDSLPLDATYFTDEGYLVDHPIVTSVGIFVYHNPDGSERRELRLPEEVFAEKSLASYKGKPVIITHDAGYVDTDNVKEESIGTILSEGYRDGDVLAEVRETRKRLDDHVKVDDQRNADLLRSRILQFNCELIEDRKHTREDFIEILTVIDSYEDYCHDHPEYKNNRCTHAVANVKRVYDDRLAKHDFA